MKKKIIGMAIVGCMIMTLGITAFANSLEYGGSNHSKNKKGHNSSTHSKSNYNDSIHNSTDHNYNDGEIHNSQEHNSNGHTGEEHYVGSTQHVLESLDMAVEKKIISYEKAKKIKTYIDEKQKKKEVVTDVVADMIRNKVITKEEGNSMNEFLQKQHDFNKEADRKAPYNVSQNEICSPWYS